MLPARCDLRFTLVSHQNSDARTFDTLGESTYSAILLAIDTEGYSLFHLLVLSVKRIYPREQELIEAVKVWLLGEDIAWNVPDDEALLPPIELPF